MSKQPVRYSTRWGFNPFKLRDQAWFVVSHMISTDPGRQARIAALEVPQQVKKLLNFQEDKKREKFQEVMDGEVRGEEEREVKLKL